MENTTKKIAVGTSSRFVSIPNFENSYSINKLGEVKSKKTKPGTIMNTKSGKVTLSDGTNKRSTTVKKLLSEVFPPVVRLKNTSKTKGVSFCQTYQNFRVMIRVNGASKHIGRFKTEKEATKAAKQAYLDFAPTPKKTSKKAKKSKTVTKITTDLGVVRRNGKAKRNV